MMNQPRNMQAAGRAVSPLQPQPRAPKLSIKQSITCRAQRTPGSTTCANGAAVKACPPARPGQKTCGEQNRWSELPRALFAI